MKLSEAPFKALPEEDVTDAGELIDWHHNQRWVRRWVQVASLALAVLLIVNFLRGEWFIFYINVFRAMAMFGLYRVLFRSRPFSYWQVPSIGILIFFNVINTYMALHRTSGVEYMIVTNLLFGLLLFRRSLWALLAVVSSLVSFSIVQYCRAYVFLLDISPERRVINMVIWFAMVVALIYEILQQCRGENKRLGKLKMTSRLR